MSLPTSEAGEWAPIEDLAGGGARPTGDLLRAGTVAVAARVVGIAVSLATGVLTARMLGPSGKGTLAFLSAATALIVRAGSLGLDGSFAHFYLTRRQRLADCVGVALWTSLAVGIVSAVLAEAAIFLFPRLMAASPPSLSVPFFATMPALFVLFVSTFIFFGLKREAFFAGFDIGYRTVLLGAFLAAFALKGALAAAVWVQVTVSVTFAVIATVAIGRAVGWHFPLNRQLAREMMQYGARYYTYGLLRYALCYQGVLIAGILLTATDAGLFAVAATFGEAIMLFAGSINLAFYPAVATVSAPHAYTASVARRIVGLSCLLGVVMALLARPLIAVVYGSAFLPSASAFLWMLPGWIVLSGEQVMSSYFASKGMPWTLVATLLVGTIAGVVLAGLFSTGFGVNGVAFAIGLSQALVSLAVMAQFARSA